LIAASASAQTALDIVLGSEDHKTLASLAGTLPAILDVLKSEGPLTLFAPTDDAFNKLDQATLDAVTADSDLLTKVLHYHVIAGVAFDPASAPAKSFPDTALGQKVSVSVSDHVIIGFGLGTSTVTGSVTASNGVVHVVDTVLVPPPSASETAKAAGLNELVKALSSASLVEAVDNVEKATIFAPTDAAFENLFAFAEETGLEITPDLLESVLKLHVVPSVVFSTDIAASAEPITAESLSTSSVNVKLADGKVLVSGKGNDTPATVVTADVLYNNGVVHVIDTVLLPDLENVGTGSGAINSGGLSLQASAIPAAIAIAAAAFM
jgi:uncharacterized surface protein with fasciclin (FAS1) repeats